jgi:hypothetical protein
VIQVTEALHRGGYAVVVPVQTRELIMTANIGDIDRVLRIVTGLVILGLFFVLEGPNRWLALVGFALLVTGLVRWCPAYLPFGISSRKRISAFRDCCG